MKLIPKMISAMNDCVMCHASCIMRQSAQRTVGNAFTFIELLIVVIVIGILIGVSIPQFRKTFDNFELENFVKDIYYLSRYLQGRAIGEEKICCLNIALEKKELWATYKGEGEFKKIEGKFGKNYKFPERVNVTLNPMGQSEITSIYFYPDGSIDRITITFENRHKKQVSLIVKGAAGVIQIQ